MKKENEKQVMINHPTKEKLREKLERDAELMREYFTNDDGYEVVISGYSEVDSDFNYKYGMFTHIDYENNVVACSKIFYYKQDDIVGENEK